jgi:hypothetical protein
MDIAICLEKLGLSQYHWGPDISTYEKLASKWPASNPPLPSKAEFENVWNIIKDDIAWAPTRQKRNLLLQESDWTQSADSPVNRQTWAEYRQKLRDITETFSSPEDVIWPLKPGQ